MKTIHEPQTTLKKDLNLHIMTFTNNEPVI